MRSILYFFIVSLLLLPAVLGNLNDATLLSQTTGDSNSLSGETLIVTEQPADYGQMVEVTELSEGAELAENKPSSEFNAMWVVDYDGEMNDSLSLPLDSYVRVFITPMQSGNVVIEQLYPDDQLETFDVGSVEAFHTYKMWFNGNATGTYQLRYSVNGGEYSNVIEFYVG